MPNLENPRVHAEMLPALAAVVGPTTKILAIGSVTAKGTPEAIAPVLPSSLARADPRPLHQCGVLRGMADAARRWKSNRCGIW